MNEAGESDEEEKRQSAIKFLSPEGKHYPLEITSTPMRLTRQREAGVKTAAPYRTGGRPRQPTANDQSLGGARYGCGALRRSRGLLLGYS